MIPERALIVGGGRIGTDLAHRLERRGEDVVIVEMDDDVVEELRTDGFTVHSGDGTEPSVLEAAGIGNANVLAAATRDDDVNLLAGQLAKNTYDVDTVVARVTEPMNLDAFEDVDVEAISSSQSVAWSMDNVIERPGISAWMRELDQDGDVQEVEVDSTRHVGKTVADLDDELPDGVHIALIGREGSTRLPEADDVLREGDHLTFIGREEAVRDAIGYCQA